MMTPGDPSPENGRARTSRRIKFGGLFNVTLRPEVHAPDPVPPPSASAILLLPRQNGVSCMSCF